LAGDNVEESSLLQRFRSGEAKACLLCERWAGEVVRSPRYGIEPSERADLIQETLRQTWEAIQAPDFTLVHSLRALVHKIAMARCIDWLRRRQVLVLLQDDWLSSFTDPTERLEFERRLDRLHLALQEIKPLCRDLVRWRFHEQRAYEDIAAVTGRNPTTLRVHMLECLKALRALMASGGFR